MQQLHNTAYLPSYVQHAAPGEKFYVSAGPHFTNVPNGPEQLYSGGDTQNLPVANVGQALHEQVPDTKNNQSFQNDKNPAGFGAAVPPYRLTSDFTGSADGTQELRGDEKACELSSGRSLKDSVYTREEVVSPEEPESGKF